MQEFTDNPPGSAHYDSIRWMQCEGISTGYVDGSFGRNRDATRAESMMLLHRYADQDHTPSSNQRFSDVPADSVGFTSIDWAVSNGITVGYKDGTFGYRKPVSRGEFATFMYRWLDPEPSSAPAKTFRDVPAGVGHHEAISWMSSEGVIGGYTDGTFRPHRSITRAEMAAIMHRVDKNIDPHSKQEPFVAPSTPVNTPHAGTIQIKQNTSTTDTRPHSGVFKDFTSGIAPDRHKLMTPDDSTVPALAKVDQTKTAADLRAVEEWSPLDPEHYLARDTYAQRDVRSAPRAENSAQITQTTLKLPDLYLNDFWKGRLLTGANVGGGVHAHDNIPIYTVDSSNPHQSFATFATTDGRVINFPKLKEMTSGKIPLPTWAKPSDGGDKALAIYDKGTGIWRSYFHVTKQADGTYAYASAGYWYGDAPSQSAGVDNYWLSLIQGSSSVVGMSNELTQVGLEELKAGSIDHTISVTFPNYHPDASFPAAQTDGNLDPAKYPHAPKAGQMFTFPADFDVDAYAKANGLDDVNRMLMHAVAQHGGIVSDRNFWSMAFNFENPYGIAQYAREGKNAWVEDPGAKALMDRYQPNHFPWDKVVWLVDDYADHHLDR